MYLQSQKGSRARFPNVSKTRSLSTFDFDIQQRASHRIKSCRIDQSVELVRSLFCFHAPFGDLFNTALTKIDQGDVVLVKGIIIMAIDHWPLATNRIVAGH